MKIKEKEFKSNDVDGFNDVLQDIFGKPPSRITVDILRKKFRTKEYLKEFLTTDIKKSLETLMSADIKHLDKTVNLIEFMIKNNKPILIISDFDCDGISAAAIFIRVCIDVLNYKNIHIMENRRKDGRGINPTVVKRVKELNDKKPIGLILTADQGSSDAENIKIIKKEFNIPIIVTDHHTINSLPDIEDATTGIVNPQTLTKTYDHTTQDPDLVYNLQSISGAGVLWLVMYKVAKTLSLTDIETLNNKMKDTIPLFMLTTISDFMPFDSYVNRGVLKYGLDIINDQGNNYWRTIKDELRLKGRTTAKDLSFSLIPIVNASGRIYHPEAGVKLLAANTSVKIKNALLELKKVNDERKSLARQVSSLSVVDDTDAIVLSIVENPPAKALGVSSTVASKYINAFSKPAISAMKTTVAGDGEVYAISVRGFGHANLLALCKTLPKELCIFANGHASAFGGRVPADKIHEFHKELCKIYKEKHADTLEPEILFDIDVKNLKTDLSMEVFKELNTLEPFGHMFEFPVFKIDGIKISSPLKVGYDLEFDIMLNGDTMKGSVNNYFVPGFKESSQNIKTIIGNLKLKYGTPIFEVTKYIT